MLPNRFPTQPGRGGELVDRRSRIVNQDVEHSPGEARQFAPPIRLGYPMPARVAAEESPQRCDRALDVMRARLPPSARRPPSMRSTRRPARRAPSGPRLDSNPRRTRRVGPVSRRPPVRSRPSTLARSLVPRGDGFGRGPRAPTRIPCGRVHGSSASRPRRARPGGGSLSRPRIADSGRVLILPESKATPNAIPNPSEPLFAFMSSFNAAQSDPQKTNRNIVVIGSTGRTGRLVLAEGLRRGHSMTAFTRRPDGLAGIRGLRSVVRGDGRNLDD